MGLTIILTRFSQNATGNVHQSLLLNLVFSSLVTAASFRSRGFFTRTWVLDITVPANLFHDKMTVSTSLSPNKMGGGSAMLRLFSWSSHWKTYFFSFYNLLTWSIDACSYGYHHCCVFCFHFTFYANRRFWKRCSLVNIRWKTTHNRVLRGLLMVGEMLIKDANANERCTWHRCRQNKMLRAAVKTTSQ